MPAFANASPLTACPFAERETHERGIQNPRPNGWGFLIPRRPFRRGRSENDRPWNKREKSTCCRRSIEENFFKQWSILGEQGATCPAVAGTDADGARRPAAALSGPLSFHCWIHGVFRAETGRSPRRRGSRALTRGRGKHSQLSV